MSAEAVTHSTEIERLGSPDLVGSWEGNGSGNFQLWILRRTSQTVDCSVVPGLGIIDGYLMGVDVIEGVIHDRVGFSVFSGVATSEGITFIKTYSAAARKRGGFGNIKYEGRYVRREFCYRGNYSVEGTAITGPFEIHSPTVSLPQDR